MRDIAEFDILVLPGLYNSGPDHWQSHWEAAFPNMQRVQQDDWDRPVYAEWARRLSEEVDRSTKPVLLIAHSLGTSLVMRWAHAAKIQAVAGAFLDATAEGSRARADGVARENCPCPPGSEECEEWLEGYDGVVEPANPAEGNGGNPPADPSDDSQGT
jgi:predicted alpha/beta hydrolase family esterase